MFRLSIMETKFYRFLTFNSADKKIARTFRPLLTHISGSPFFFVMEKFEVRPLMAKLSIFNRIEVKFTLITARKVVKRCCKSFPSHRKDNENYRREGKASLSVESSLDCYLLFTISRCIHPFIGET